MAKDKKSFLDEMDEIIKKYSHLNEDKDVLIPTGLLPLDYGNGKRINVYGADDDIIDMFDQIGIAIGTVCGVTGESSTGKSALIYSSAGSVLANYPKADCHIIDAENSFDKERFKNLTNISASTMRDRVKIEKTRVIEEVGDYIVKLVKEKLSKVDELMVDTHYRNMFGEKIRILTPSIVIIDSWTILQPREQISKALETGSGQEYSNNMQAATRAKINNAVVKLLNDLARIANINIYLIHHTQKAIQAGFFADAAQNMHLGGDKKLTGGTSSVYLSSNLFETVNLGKLKADGTRTPNYGIDGFIVGVKVAKSRTNSTGKVLPCIFDYSIGGMNRLLTLLHFAFDNDIVKGSGQKYYFESLPDETFSRKNFKEVTIKNPKLISVLFDECKDKLSDLLSNTEDELETDSSILAAFM